MTDTDRPLERVEPFVAKWATIDNVEWLVPFDAADTLSLRHRSTVSANQDGEWFVYNGVCVYEGGYSSDLPTAKRDALAKARELGLCCWFEGEAPMAFEGEWKRLGALMPWWGIRLSDGDWAVEAHADGVWQVWDAAGDAKVGHGRATDLESAKAAALEAAARHGYRITIREAAEPGVKCPICDERGQTEPGVISDLGGPCPHPMCEDGYLGDTPLDDAASLAAVFHIALDWIEHVSGKPFPPSEEGYRNREFIHIAEKWLTQDVPSWDELNGHAKPAPFVIEAWSYWTDSSGILVTLTPDGPEYRNRADGVWRSDSASAPLTHVPNPPHRHPDDPANIPAAVRECIEKHGADVVRRALESM